MARNNPAFAQNSNEGTPTPADQQRMAAQTADSVVDADEFNREEARKALEAGNEAQGAPMAPLNAPIEVRGYMKSTNEEGVLIKEQVRPTGNLQPNATNEDSNPPASGTTEQPQGE